MRFSLRERNFVEVEKDAEAIAVWGSDGKLSWSELASKTRRIEEKLQRLGVKPGHPVVIVGHKQSEYIASICACLKLGCPYIPVDDIYPEKRIERIIELARPFCVINLNESRTTVHSAPQLLSHDLAYLIFTSGSTGEPKGVQISIENVLSLLEWMDTDFALPAKSVFMNQAPFSFDLSVYELMYAIHFGQTLVLSSRSQIGDQDHFFERLKKLRANVWVSTPSFAWSQCLSEKFNEDYLPLDCFLFCGEVLSAKVAKKLKSLFPKARILNTYGPTEATVATTLIEITEEIISKYPNLPIGYPKEGTLVYPDEQSEICIVGPNVMVGYLNRPDLNESKMFSLNGVRGFRTGDIGFIQDGLLFCSGRLDDQVKLHGYRIELNEIDNVVAKSNPVEVACTVAVKRGSDVVRLVCFVKLHKESSESFSEFYNKLKESLPYYMLPHEFILLEEFPHSVNHKIDRKKLLELYTTSDLNAWT